MSTHTDKAKASFTLIELPVVRKRKSYAFTLIELLVVIAIIGILAGIVFKLMSRVTRSGAKADCIQRLECLSYALEEYRAEYGQYPPVNFVKYEYENVTNQTDWLRNSYTWDGGETLFQFGLVAHLWTRDRGNGNIISDAHKILLSGDNNPGVNWIGDVSRDENVKARWAPFLETVRLWGWYQVRNANPGPTPYSNNIETIIDPWYREVHYECVAPYLSYKLWSNGPDGINGTPDDIHRDKWDN